MKLRSAILGMSSIVWGIAVVCAAALLADAHTAQAGINVWTSHGPGEGLDIQISALVIDPITPTTVYVGTSAGVFKSTDGGGNWQAVTAVGVIVLGIDPHMPSTVYAGTGVNLFKSTDGGETWRDASTGLVAIRPSTGRACGS